MKNESDGLNKITTKFLKENGYFNGTGSGIIKWTRNEPQGENKSSVGIEILTEEGKEYLRIHYTQTEINTKSQKDFNYKILLTKTSCKYGGKRYWFICPYNNGEKQCGKRIGTLYKDGDYFACRHCYDLTYSSKKTNRRNKIFPMYNVLALERKLEGIIKQIKRPYYRGQPTRKQRQLEKTYCQLIFFVK